jgi:hypothetical protein
VAELRRLHFVGGVSIRELQRRTGLRFNTIRRALRADEPPRYQRRAWASKFDPFRDAIQRLLREGPRLLGIRVLELIAELGFQGLRGQLDLAGHASRPRAARRAALRRR